MEKRVTLRTPAGPRFLGYMDIFDSRGEVPTILDVKSKGNLDYTLNEFQLGEDIQLSIYALYAMETLKVDRVKLVHVYVLRDEEHPEVKIVSSFVERAQVEKIWGEVSDIVATMMEYWEANLQSSLDVSGNEDSCFAFGRPCHYLDQCEPQSPLVGLRVQKNVQKEEEVMTNTVTDSESNLLETLRKKKAAARGVVAESAPPSEPVAPPVSAAITIEASVLPPDAPPRTTKKKEKPSPTTLTVTPSAASPVVTTTAPAPVTFVSNTKRTVYMGCAPVGRAISLFTTWVAPIESEVATKNRVAHWGMIEYHANGILATAMKERLDTLPSEIYVNGNEPAAGVFLSLLTDVEVVR